MPQSPLLTVDALSVTFARSRHRDIKAVDGISFTLEQGKVSGLVGESGCGKSVTALALMGLLPRRGAATRGEALFRPEGGERADLLSLPARRMRDLRGREIAMVFQDPLSSLNPVVPIGVQVTEILTRHRGLKGAAARSEAADLLARVGIGDPGRRLREYPHELSGGMRQRALIAMAVACRPRLMIADEPTTALDVTIQAQILELLKELVTEEGTALLMITHDLGIVAGLCDDINVLYAGKAVEGAPRHGLFAEPAHPYTAGLMASIPRLDASRGDPLTPIRGTVSDAIDWSDGCAFAPRCDHFASDCLDGPPPMFRFRPAHRYRCLHPVGTAAIGDPGAPSDAAEAPREGTAAPTGGQGRSRGSAPEPGGSRDARAYGPAVESGDEYGADEEGDRR